MIPKRYFMTGAPFKLSNNVSSLELGIFKRKSLAPDNMLISRNCFYKTAQKNIAPLAPFFWPSKKSFITNAHLTIHTGSSHIENIKPKMQIQLLDKYHRSNQDTCLVHKPAVKVGEWVESGDLLADNSASMHGELAIGKNILVAYMPWEGFNYEDAILINERLVYDDVYTSIHIERYEIETKNSQFGGEQITRDIPDINHESIAHLDKYGIASIGSWIEEGDVLVGKVTPINKKSQTPYQRLLFKLLDKTLNSVRDSSLRAPKGIKANVIHVQILAAGLHTNVQTLKQKDILKKPKNTVLSLGLTKSSSIIIEKIKSKKLNSSLIGPIKIHTKHGQSIAFGEGLQPKAVNQGEKKVLNIKKKVVGLNAARANQFSKKTWIAQKRHNKNSILSAFWGQQNLVGLTPKALNHFDKNLQQKSNKIKKLGLSIDTSYVRAYKKCSKSSKGSLIAGTPKTLPQELSFLWLGRRPTHAKFLGQWVARKRYGLAVGQPMSKKNNSAESTIQKNIILNNTTLNNVWTKVSQLFFNNEPPITKQRVTRSKSYSFKTQNIPLAPKWFNVSSDVLCSKNDLGLPVNPLRTRNQIKTRRTVLLESLDQRFASKTTFLGPLQTFSAPNRFAVGQTITKKGIIYHKPKKIYGFGGLDKDLRSWTFHPTLPTLCSLKKNWLRVCQLRWQTQQKKEVSRKKRKRSLKPSSAIGNGAFGPIIDNKIARRPLLKSSIIPTNVHIYLAEKRKIQVGDKMAGRHGNKGIISNILPRQDMPYLPDGTAVDIVLNPLGVPSRMNVGQIYECLLGLAGKYLGEHYKIFPFDEIYGPEASRSFVFAKLFEASKKTGIEWLFDVNSPGKIRLLDGRTGACFDQPITVGIAYMLKLVHMVDDKIHMRSTGPYSLVTQQPLRGRAKQGGQRLGEMEVWAIEGYGAAFVLLEMLTLKSDDMTGRLTLWSNLILNKEITVGTPESFKVLVCELQALCLDIGLFNLTSVSGGQKAKDLYGWDDGPTMRLKEISHLMLLP